MEIDILASTAARHLNALGIWPQQVCYWYLLAGQAILLQQPYLLTNERKLLYGEIAKRCNNSPAAIEKGIRYAILRCWTNDTLQPLQPYCPAQGRRPTNAEFLAALAIWLAEDGE